MTAEIAILNKSAVALATDSAVTIEKEDGPTRVYNSANKLFTLSKYEPVGVMIYGNVEFMGLPWETIIKTFRQSLGTKSFKRLQQYADNFISFLDKPNPFVPPRLQAAYVEMVARSAFKVIAKEALDEAQKSIEKKGKLADDKEFLSILRAGIKSILGKVRERDRLAHLPKSFENLIVKKYAKAIQKAREDVFHEVPLTAANRRDLRAIVGGLFARNHFPSHSGIVVAGFGKSEMFPAVKSFRVACHVAGRLKYAVDRKHDVGSDRNAAILPFAQDDMVHTFMEGASLDYINLQQQVWENGLAGYGKAVLDKVAKKLSKSRKALEKAFKAEADKWVADVQQEMTKWRSVNYINPVMDTVAVLPKDELASMAEALVSLTSFKRKVTIGEEETVGGPIDVAVISKGDGFIWIKRKHYFTLDYNPHFCARYFGGKTQ